MSENKFRVWCKNKNEWEKDLILIAPDGSLFTDFRGRFIPISSENHHVMRYTGWNDRHGRAIFEGDIVFKEGFALAKVYFHDLRWYPALISMDCEIIGNIYENPELLQVKEG